MRTFGKLVYKNKEWLIPRLEAHVAIRIKAIFSKIAKQQAANWTLLDSTENARELLWFIDRYPLEISDQDLEYLKHRKTEHITRLDRLEQLMKPDYQPTLFSLKLPLRTYQAQAVDLYLANGMLLLGDEVGTGKTPTAIGSFCDARTLPALVVVQTHLPTQWKEQISKFTDLKVHIIKGTRPYNLPSADVYIMKYSCLSGWVG